MQRQDWRDIDWQPYVDASNVGLLIIDAQNNLLSPDGSLAYYGMHEAAASSMCAIHRLVHVARQAAVPVLWTRYFRDDPEGRPRQTMVDGRIANLRNRHPEVFDLSHWETRIYDGLLGDIEESDIVLTKRTSGSFSGTDLQRVLTRMSLTNLVITGFFTDFCVASTAREAYDLGFGSIIVEDACASTSISRHEAAIDAHVANFGPVIGSDEFATIVCP